MLEAKMLLMTLKVQQENIDLVVNLHAAKEERHQLVANPSVAN